MSQIENCQRVKFHLVIVWVSDSLQHQVKYRYYSKSSSTLLFLLLLRLLLCSFHCLLIAQLSLRILVQLHISLYIYLFIYMLGLFEVKREASKRKRCHRASQVVSMNEWACWGIWIITNSWRFCLKAFVNTVKPIWRVVFVASFKLVCMEPQKL